MKTKKIKMEVFPDLGLSFPIRTFLHEFFKNFTDNESVSRKFVLAFDEFFTNSVKHGSKEGCKITIKFWYEDEYIYFEISDEGGEKPIDANELLKIVKQDLKSDPLRSRGRGISMLIPNLCDEFEIENNDSGGITVRAWKKLV